MILIKGIVRWFDDIKGEGMIRSEGGISYYINHADIVTNNQNFNYETITTLEKNQAVKFEVYDDGVFKQCFNVELDNE